MKSENPINAAELKRLLAAASSGPWRIDHGLMGDSLNITTSWRERAEGDGPICRVSKERLILEKEKGFGGRSSSYHKAIKAAEADAKLIVAAVNALPELLRRAKLDVDEIAWLIEWPADKYGPIRYYAAGEPPVVNASDATRFSREQDAQAFMRSEKLTGAKAVEHMWLAPKPKLARDRDAAVGRDAKAARVPKHRQARAEGIVL